MDSHALIDVAGWTGATALLLGYALISTKRIEGDSITYQFLNVVGSVLLILNAFYYGAYPSVGVNLVWIAIGFYALTRKRWGSRKKLS